MTTIDPQDPVIAEVVARMVDARVPKIRHQVRVECADELDQAGHVEAAEFLRRPR